MAFRWFRKRTPDPAALAQTALERAQALAHFGTWEWNPAANRVTWSAQLHHIYGLEPGAPGGFDGTFDGYLSRVHADDRERVAATVTDALARKTGFRLRERIVRPDGEERILSTAGDVVLDDAGHVALMFGACHDVTEQVRGDEERRVSEHRRVALEQQFFQAQKLEAIGRLAGGIAHDFNNMLLVILGSVSLLLDRTREDDAQWKDLRAIENAAERAGGLTRQLLAVARRQIFTVADVDLNDVIRDVEDMLRRSLGDDVRLLLRLADESLVVHADAGQLQQVLLNLAVNARDAMPGGGTLTLSTRAARDAEGRETAIAEVADTGAGMDAEVLRHLFEPFFTTKGEAGTGLGLATVYGIVTQSGGHVEVASTPGRGSVFTVHLPRMAEATPVTAREQEPATAARGEETVLVVDDSEPVLALTGRILDRAGYQVMTAPNGEWALSVAERHPGTIDLLLTDVMMPGLSGPQLARRLSAMRPATRVLYMTGYQRATDEGELAVPAGAHLIEKPFKPDALLRMIRQTLSRNVDGKSLPR